MNARAIWWGAVLALSVAGACAPGSNSTSGESRRGTSGKADTDEAFHVDAARESALVALGLEDRFLVPGDKWEVAWVYRNDDSPHRDGQEQLGNATFQPPTLVRYEVIELSDVDYGAITRRAATVSVKAGHAATPTLAALLAPPSDAVDSQVDYRINDLFNPIAKRYYSVDEKGITTSRLVALDGRANLTMQFDSLPNGYPNLDRVIPRATCGDDFFANLTNPAWSDYTACFGAAPELPADLGAVASAAGVDTRAPGLHIKSTSGQPDAMFWRPGDLHPVFVSGPRGYGLLVSETPAE